MNAHALDHFLVVIEPDQDEQPALTQALNWAQALEQRGQKAHITALLTVYNYAAEINTMMTGTVLHNLHRDLVRDAEEWLSQVIDRTVKSSQSEQTTNVIVDTPITPEVVWAKRGFKGVEMFLEEHARQQKLAIKMIFKSLSTHPVYERLLMQIDEWQLVRISHAPVMLVHNTQPIENIDWLVAVDPHNPQHIRLNGTVLDFISDCQTLLGGKLALAHAYPSIPERMTPILSTYSGGEYIVGTNPEEDEDRIDEFLKVHQLKREQLHSSSGPIEEVIQERLSGLSNPLLVLGSRAQPGFADRLVGHTAEKLIEHAQGNILVVKQSEVS